MAQFRGTRSDTVVVGVAELRVGASRLRSVFDWPLFFEGTAWQSSAIAGSFDESSRIWLSKSSHFAWTSCIGGGHRSDPSRLAPSGMKSNFPTKERFRWRKKWQTGSVSC